MKKVLSILFFLFAFIASYGQGFPVQSFMGSTQTLVRARGGFGADSAIVFTTNRADTSVLNAGFLDQVPGAIVKVQDTLWMRNSAATAWIKIGSGGGSNDFILNQSYATTRQIARSKYDSSWMLRLLVANNDSAASRGFILGYNNATRSLFEGKVASFNMLDTANRVNDFYDFSITANTVVQTTTRLVYADSAAVHRENFVSLQMYAGRSENQAAIFSLGGDLTAASKTMLGFINMFPTSTGNITFTAVTGTAGNSIPATVSGISTFRQANTVGSTRIILDGFFAGMVSYLNMTAGDSIRDHIYFQANAFQPGNGRSETGIILPLSPTVRNFSWGIYVYDPTQSSYNWIESQLGVGSGFGTWPTAPSFPASSQLTVNSTTRGFLAPRMTAAQRIAIASPATGLTLTDTDSLRVGFYNGSTWKMLAFTTDIGTGTVTSVATNTGSGIFGGTITTSGTIAADTTILATRLRAIKIADSLAGGGGSGVVDNGDQFEVAHYAGVGTTTTVSGFDFLKVGQSTTSVQALSQASDDIVFEIKGTSGQTANFLNISSSTGTADLLEFTAGNEMIFGDVADGGDFDVQPAKGVMVHNVGNNEVGLRISQNSSQTSSLEIHNNSTTNWTIRALNSMNLDLVTGGGTIGFAPGFSMIGTINTTGAFFGGSTVPVARLGVGAGGASQSQFRLTSGTERTTPVAGDIEYNGDFKAAKANNVRFAFAGTLLTNTTAVGNVGGGTDDLITASLPAGSLSTDGSFIEIEMGFTTAANTNSKTITFTFGSFTYTIPAFTTSGTTVSLVATVIRTGAATQLVTLRHINDNGTVQTVGSLGGSPATETLSGAITIKATGAATSNDDIVQRLLIIKYWGPNPDPT